MLNPVPKSINFLDYLNFGALFDIFLWSMCDQRIPEATDRLRDRDNSAGIGDNSAEIGDDAAGIVDITVKLIPR